MTTPRRIEPVARKLEADDRIEIAAIEDLREAMRRVESADETIVVSVDDEAVLRAVPRWLRRRTPEPRAADDAAFLSAAGGWNGLIDPDELKKQIREGRGANRPAVDPTLPEE